MNARYDPQTMTFTFYFAKMQFSKYTTFPVSLTYIYYFYFFSEALTKIIYVLNVLQDVGRIIVAVFFLSHYFVRETALLP